MCFKSPWEEDEPVSADCRVYLAQLCTDVPVYFCMRNGVLMCDVIGTGKRYFASELSSEHADVVARAVSYFNLEV